MKTIGFEWRLREVMAAAGMFTTTKLITPLQERGINLSASQVYRLAAEKPERLNMAVLVALMDIFDCTADDLIGRVALGVTNSSTGTEGPTAGKAAEYLRQNNIRPKRALILPPDDE